MSEVAEWARRVATGELAAPLETAVARALAGEQVHDGERWRGYLLTARACVDAMPLPTPFEAAQLYLWIVEHQRPIPDGQVEMRALSRALRFMVDRAGDEIEWVPVELGDEPAEAADLLKVMLARRPARDPQGPELLQPYTTFEWTVPCSLCDQDKAAGTRMACLPDDDSYDTTDPWGCKECVEADDRFVVAASDAQWRAVHMPGVKTNEGEG